MYGQQATHATSFLPILSHHLPPLQAGGYYPIDLIKPPFNLSPPLEVLDENTEHGKHMLLFNVQSMTWDDPLGDSLFSARAATI
jgi:hypothetical protein